MTVKSDLKMAIKTCQEMNHQLHLLILSDVRLLLF